MNKLPLTTRTQILSMLVEGCSMRSISRVADVSINTVAKLLVDAGLACEAYHDENVRNLASKRVQVDEIWSFTYAKAANVKAAKSAPHMAGDTWTWTALCADTKLIVSYLVGTRDSDCAMMFCHDVASRLAGRVQLTSDGHRPYVDAVDAAFDGEVDYAQLVKIYGPSPEGQRRYSPPVCNGTKKKAILGSPDRRHVSTSFVERQNLNIRMGNRRFTRLTNGFSKRIESHIHQLSLYFMFYNFVRIHTTLRVTPAMAAGVTDRLWDVADIIAMIDAREEAPKKRGPYKKKVDA